MRVTIEKYPHVIELAFCIFQLKNIQFVYSWKCGRYFIKNIDGEDFKTNQENQYLARKKMITMLEGFINEEIHKGEKKSCS